MNPTVTRNVTLLQTSWLILQLYESAPREESNLSEGGKQPWRIWICRLWARTQGG